MVFIEYINPLKVNNGIYSGTPFIVGKKWTPYTPYIVVIYWLYPLLNGSNVGGGKCCYGTVPRVPQDFFPMINSQFNPLDKGHLHDTNPINVLLFPDFSLKITADLHSRNLTNWYQELPCLYKGSYLFQTISLGIHVSFRGCKHCLKFRKEPLLKNSDDSFPM